MADRQTPPPRRPGDSGGRRQPPYRDGGEQRQVSYREGGERRQVPPSGGERRPVPPGGGERRQAPPGGSERPRRQAPPRRNDVIRCENCGEDYSVTYKRCPFCDERPSRGGISGKRIANTRGGGYGRPASTLKTVSWIASFIVVIAAMVIIYRFMDAPIFGGKRPNPNPGTSSSQGSGTGSSQPGHSSQPDGPDVSVPPDNSADPGPVDPPAPTETQGTIVNAGKGLNVRSGPGRDNSVIDSIANNSQVVVVGEENGWYQIRYGDSNIGYVSKEFVSTADAPVAVIPTPDPEHTTDPGPGGDNVTSGSQGTINASNGLRIRSGPSTSDPVVASADNGAQVTILGEENGWYHIRYRGNETGYVSKEYVTVG